MRKPTSSVSLWPALAAVLICVPGLLAAAGETGGGAPDGTFRAAQDRGLNLDIDPDRLAEDQADATSGAPPGSFRAAQDEHYRVDWSRRLGGQWQMNPVLLNRRQAGQPDHPDDDASNKVLGIELRKRF